MLPATNFAWPFKDSILGQNEIRLIGSITISTIGSILMLLLNYFSTKITHLFCYCASSLLLAIPGYLHSLQFTALVKALFQSKSVDIFLISPQKHMLWYSLEAAQ